MIHPQLTLELDTSSLSSFDSFYASDSNAQVLSAVQAFSNNELGELQVFLWGETSVGKTHLLSAACKALSTSGFKVAYLNGELASKADALEGMENMDLVCIDDLQLLSANAEQSAFHLINRCRDANTRLLIASKNSIEALPFTLADLKTRLSWGLVFQLQALQEDELRSMFRLLLEQKSLKVSDEVLDYVLRRYPRNASALKTLADQLDKISMSTQRPITIPLVKSVSESTV